MQLSLLPEFGVPGLGPDTGFARAEPAPSATSVFINRNYRKNSGQSLLG